MNITKLYKNTLLSQKNKVLVEHSRMQSIFDKVHGKLSQLPDSIENYGDGLFSSREYNQLTANKDWKEEWEFKQWADILELVFIMDRNAVLYYYKMFALFLSLMVVDKNKEICEKSIKEHIVCFYIYAFSSISLNKVFNEQLELECMKLLPLISITIECGYAFDMRKNEKFKKIPLANMYYQKREEIIREGSAPLKRISKRVEDSEYISDSKIERFIDETDQYCQTYLGLLDLELSSRYHQVDC
ncbi:MAG: hypothetical protein AAB441_00990 [Patescibacteria group bacterium]